MEFKFSELKEIEVLTVGFLSRFLTAPDTYFYLRGKSRGWVFVFLQGARSWMVKDQHAFMELQACGYFKALGDPFLKIEVESTSLGT